MTIRQIIKDGLLKLKVKYPHDEEDNFFLDLQNSKIILKNKMSRIKILKILYYTFAKMEV